jgi:3-hydroxyacyl-CoA dehydrogenase
VANKLNITRQDGVAVVQLSNAPQNFLGPLVRTQLSAQLKDLMQDETVQAIVLTGQPLSFSEGYSLVNPDLRQGAVALAEICLQIEDSNKPVVACLTGAALGAGFELALAAHARVAQAGTRVGMTDIAMGLLPGAGGSQRLPRLVGAQTALTLMLSGEVAEVSDPRLAPVFDQISDEAPAAALALARSLAEQGGQPRKTRDRNEGFADPLAYQAAIKACRSALSSAARPAQKAVVTLVENALVLPFAAGLALEEDLYQQELQSDDAQGNLHMLHAMRRLGNLPEAAKAKPLTVQHVGIVGSGPAALALVSAAVTAGQSTIWFERDEAAVRAATERLEQAMDAQKMPPDQWYKLMQALNVTHDPMQLAQADLVIEAVADNPRTKAQVMAWLAQIMPAASILVSHSASLPVAPTAQASGREGQVVGLSIQQTARRLRLAEVIPGPNTTAAAVMTLRAGLQQMGISAVRCGSQGGSIGMRMMAALREAADYALDLGASPALVDQALVSFGCNAGVFAAMDAAGLLAELDRALHMPQMPHKRHLARLQALVDQGRLGRTAGKGFYDWAQDTPQPRAQDVLGPDAPDANTITQLCLGAMMNEGARLLREGVALRPSDIDLVMVRAHGFPAWRGGVMNAADQMGLFTLQRAMRPHAGAAPGLFAPDPGIEALIRNGEGFAALNGVGAKRRRIEG